MKLLRRIFAYVLLISVYGLTWLVAVVARAIPRRAWKPTGRIVVTGTFHNPNWYLSHITPLARSGVNEVILVVDEPQIPLERVRFVCPPRWAARLLTRAGAKALWMVLAGRRYRPDLYMGYHIAPGACSALVAAKLLGRPACYQMTAGPVEVIGGGIGATESVGGLLGRPSKVIEAMALSLVRSFDLVVVRGRKAKEYLEERGLRGRIAVITGAVQDGTVSLQSERQIHLVFVGRLAPLKQVDQFISVVETASRVIPSIRAAIVGDGPLMTDLTMRVDRLGLADNIKFLGKREDVRSIVLNSQVFMLTSQTEGLSIAMIEAMAAGVVPVVADIGELGDVVENGVSGYLVTPNCIAEYVERTLSLLQDQGRWQTFSERAHESALAQCRIEVISGRWQEHLQKAVNAAPGICAQEATA
jgi:glycosyltransferase involved in cell wall biosynthesis